MDSFVVAGFAGVLIIMALVELAKRLGLATRWAPVLALGLGVGFSVGQRAVAGPATAQDWFNALIVGVVAGLTAAGLFDVQKKARESEPVPHG